MNNPEMSFSETIEIEPVAKSLHVTADELIVNLADGRTISVPLVWFPRLFHGTMMERNTYELIGRGTGIHWPELDEDIRVTGLLKGHRSGESEASVNRWLASRK